ncbi:MAG: glycosyltransferase family 39 protein [Acidiferrobacteraceae bacterium]
MKTSFRASRSYLLFGAYLIVIGLIYTFTLRHGHDWDGDYALYIAHAKNIVSGHPYGETGYIPNTNNPNLSPTVYPPIFPILLAPTYKIFGLDLRAMKITVILIMLCMLSMGYLYVKRLLRDPITTYLCMVAIALSPWLWGIRDLVAPEVPFMLFLFLSLLLAEAAIIPGRSESIRKRVFLGCAAGISTYLAYGTRVVGGLLIPAFLLFDLQRHRKISTPSIAIVITFTILAIIQNQFIHSVGAYTEIIRMYSWDVFHRNVLGYARTVVAYWRSSTLGLTGAHYIFYATAPLFLLGWLTSFTKRQSIYGIFFAMYTALLIALPIYGAQRYLLPIMPFYILDIFIGSKVLGDWIGDKKGRFLPIFVAGTILIAYAMWYKDQHLGAIKDGPYSPASLELFSFVKEHTKPNSIFIFRKPRILALYTERRASPPPLPNLEDTLWGHINKIGATYIIVKYAGVTFDRVDTFPVWIDENSARLKLLFENKMFRLYKIKPTSYSSGSR